MSLSARQVSFRRGIRPVLSKVSVAVEPGELIVLVGPNGAGKSTLLRAMSGELQPNAGEIDIDGARLSTLGPRALARRRAVVAQNPGVGFDMIVEDIVALGRLPYAASERRTACQRVVDAALDRVGAREFAQRPIRSLSGGEAQRIHLARALAQVWPAPGDTSPRYLLLDEPFSALDVAWQHELVAVVRGLLAERLGVLAVMHDLNLAAQYADRLMLMRDGQVCAVGSPDAVLTAEIIHEVFGVCTSVCRHPTRACPVVIHHGHRPRPVEPAARKVAAHAAP